MSECIFCQIAEGSIPAHKIFEDDQVVAFLDIHPTIEGFTLVVPKNHSQTIWDMDKESYAHLWAVVRRVGLRIGEVYQPSKVGVQVEGLDVAHVHVKVFPFKNSAEFRAVADMSQELDHEGLAKVAEKLKF